MPGLFSCDVLVLIHETLPQPVGRGKPNGQSELMAKIRGGQNVTKMDVMAFSMITPVSNRIARGAIPYPLEDLRCSYCLNCNQDENSPPLRCSQCKKVFYCDRDCQK